MKVALVTDVYSQLSGVSTHVDLLACALSQKGIDVKVYTGSGASSKYKIINCPKIPFLLAKSYEIVFPTKKIDADVLDIQTPYLLGQAAMFLNKPRVATALTMPNNMFSDNFKWLHPLCWNYLTNFYNRADARVCLTVQTKKTYESHGLKKDANVISAGIDYSFYSKADGSAFRKKYGITCPFALTTNRLSAEKRPELALKACEELKIPIVLTSDGPMRKYLERKYPEARFLGRLSHEDLRNAYSAATVFILASAPEVEGEGLGVLEAMACKTPTLSSNVPFVSGGRNGFVFSDYGGLKDKLEMLWNSGALREKLLKEGLKHAKKEDMKVLVKKYIKLYESLI